jgi:hypothetical protein
MEIIELLPACSVDREAFSLCLHGKGDPSSLAPGGRHHLALPLEYSCYLLWCYCYARQVVLTTWKVATPPLFTLKVMVSQTLCGRCQRPRLGSRMSRLRHKCMFSPPAMPQHSRAGSEGDISCAL